MTSIIKVNNIQNSSGTAAMTIDGSGNVTCPQNVTFSGSINGLPAGSNAFAARINATEWGSATSGNLVQFNDDSGGDCFDTDNCYDTSTYKFTAPATGVYTFWYSVYTADGDTENGFGFLKNSTKLNMGSAGAKHFSYQQSTNNDHIQTAQVIVPLSSGDTIGVCASTNSDYYKGYTAWGGCRLA